MQVHCKQAGNYATAFDIREYRQGILVGRYIREATVTVANFPVNSDIYIPEDLEASITGNYEASLSWTFCNLNKRKQYIFRGINDSMNLSVIDSLEWYETAYADPGLLSNTNYYYQVIAYTGDGKPMTSPKKQLIYYGTGISALNAGSQLSLAPVPATGTCRLTAYGNPVSAYYLAGNTGQILMQNFFNEPVTTCDIDFSALSPGCYFLQIRTASGLTFVKKLAKD